MGLTWRASRAPPKASPETTPHRSTASSETLCQLCPRPPRRSQRCRAKATPPLLPSHLAVSRGLPEIPFRTPGIPEVPLRDLRGRPQQSPRTCLSHIARAFSLPPPPVPETSVAMFTRVPPEVLAILLVDPGRASSLEISFPSPKNPSSDTEKLPGSETRLQVPPPTPYCSSFSCTHPLNYAFGPSTAAPKPPPLCNVLEIPLLCPSSFPMIPPQLIPEISRRLSSHIPKASSKTPFLYCKYFPVTHTTCSRNYFRIPHSSFIVSLASSREPFLDNLSQSALAWAYFRLNSQRSSTSPAGPEISRPL